MFYSYKSVLFWKILGNKFFLGGLFGEMLGGYFKEDQKKKRVVVGECEFRVQVNLSSGEPLETDHFCAIIL
uniref:Uncharacterized protein n=1 Tax=Rhizophora mucronata TaxID=61149 RepID=A0A2P2N2P6_RHIMU